MKYNIETAQKSKFVISSDGVLSSSAHSDSRTILAEIWTTADMSCAVIVSAQQGQNFSLFEQSRKSVAHLIDIKPSPHGFYIIDTWSRRYLSVDEVENNINTYPIKASCNTPAPSKCITLISVQDDTEDSGAVLERLRSIFLKKYADAADFRNAIQNKSNSPRPDISVAATLQAMSLECLNDSLDATLSENKTLDLLKEYFPGDVWAEKSIPALMEWKSLGRPKAPSHMEVCDDWLGGKVGGISSYTRSAPHLINTFSRKCVKPSKISCLVATARNEGIYLIEWIAYHKAIGFEQIIIYSNDNTDGSDQLLSALAEKGEIIWVNNHTRQNCNAQENAYAHALNYLPYTLDYEWTMFLDLDEFLVINKNIFRDLTDFLSWHSRKDSVAIGVNWQFVGPSSQLFKSDGPITRRMNAVIGGANRHVKSFVKTRFAISQQPHFPRFDERSTPAFASSDGRQHDWDRYDENQETAPAREIDPSITHAVIYHYFLKSRDEFIWKFSRNRGNHPVKKDLSFSVSERFLKSFISHFDRREGSNVEAMAAMAPDIENDIAQLRRDPKILNSESRVMVNYQNSIVELREKFNKFITEKWPETAEEFLSITSRATQHHAGT